MSCAGFAFYFCADESFDASLVGSFLRRLRSIESWFAAQSSYRFIASSLLFVYDGDVARPHADGSTQNTSSSSLSDHFNSMDSRSANNSVSGPADNGCRVVSDADARSHSWWDQRTDLRMIDFTHAFPSSAPDENYLTGIRSIISYMSRLKPGMYEVQP